MIQRENNGPVMLLILDGFGYRTDRNGNAIAHANMPTWRMLQDRYPHTLLRASGRAVGLPDGFVGNSEVGHVTIGAGRPIMTALCKFHDSIDDGMFFQNRMLRESFERLKKEKRALHLLGLLSDAGVHSHDRHLHALIRLANSVGLTDVFIHAFLDGRDTPPRSAATYLERCENVASIHGRFYAMDRDNNWDRIQKSYAVLCGDDANGDEIDRPWREVLAESYREGITDEFVEPTLLLSKGIIKKGDGLFFFNVRPDRMHQLTQAFLDPSFAHFKTCGLTFANETLSFVMSTTRYKREFESFGNEVVFEGEPVFHTLLDEISQQTKSLPPEKRTVFIIAETEKYAHVTYFFRGQVDVELEHETRVLVPSRKVKTYIEYPEMSARELTNRLLLSLGKNPAYFYLVNYANCDMVAHSGDFEATVKACECIDEQLKTLYHEVVERLDGTIFLTSDHGNAEEMIDLATGTPRTAHTRNQVPFMIITKSLAGKTLPETSSHGLAAVAPTILRYLGLAVPGEMAAPIKFDRTLVRSIL